MQELPYLLQLRTLRLTYILGGEVYTKNPRAHPFLVERAVLEVTCVHAPRAPAVRALTGVLTGTVLIPMGAQRLLHWQKPAQPESNGAGISRNLEDS